MAWHTGRVKAEVSSEAEKKKRWKSGLAGWARAFRAGLPRLQGFEPGLQITNGGNLSYEHWFG